MMSCVPARSGGARLLRDSEQFEDIGRATDLSWI
jgi:hypothetical protein